MLHKRQQHPDQTTTDTGEILLSEYGTHNKQLHAVLWWFKSPVLDTAVVVVDVDDDDLVPRQPLSTLTESLHSPDGS